MAAPSSTEYLVNTYNKIIHIHMFLSPRIFLVVFSNKLYFISLTVRSSLILENDLLFGRKNV